MMKSTLKRSKNPKNRRNLSFSKTTAREQIVLKPSDYIQIGFFSNRHQSKKKQVQTMQRSSTQRKSKLSSLSLAQPNCELTHLAISSKTMKNHNQSKQSKKSFIREKSNENKYYRDLSQVSLCNCISARNTRKDKVTELKGKKKIIKGNKQILKNKCSNNLDNYSNAQISNNKSCSTKNDLNLSVKSSAANLVPENSITILHQQNEQLKQNLLQAYKQHGQQIQSQHQQIRILKQLNKEQISIKQKQIKSLLAELAAKKEQFEHNIQSKQKLVEKCEREVSSKDNIILSLHQQIEAKINEKQKLLASLQMHKESGQSHRGCIERLEREVSSAKKQLVKLVQENNQLKNDVNEHLREKEYIKKNSMLVLEVIRKQLKQEQIRTWQNQNSYDKPKSNRLDLCSPKKSVLGVSNF